MKTAPLATSAPPATVAIEIDGVTKLFARTDNTATSIKESILTSLVKKNTREVVVALDEVSLTVNRGEVLGIVGSNGSGKSTLLKLIAGITHPTQGRVQTHGRVLGLIELGAGIHPELTAEENIFMQGSVYGLSDDEIRSKLDAILDFSELHDFRHLQVKHFSSGMFVRLGFAIAIHTYPEIMLVDEVLAVGDQIFQERCFREIERLRGEGVTIVFITHYPEHTERLCDRVVWMERGRVRMAGATAEVLAAYDRENFQKQFGTLQGEMNEQRITLGLPGRFGTGEALIGEIRLLNGAGERCRHFRRGDAMRIEVDYTAGEGTDAVDCSMPIYTAIGEPIAWTMAGRQSTHSTPRDGCGSFAVEIDALALLPGRYGFSVALSPPGNPYRHYDHHYKLHHFTVEAEPGWEPVAPVGLTPQVEVVEHGDE